VGPGCRTHSVNLRNGSTFNGARRIAHPLTLQESVSSSLTGRSNNHAQAWSFKTRETERQAGTALLCYLWFVRCRTQLPTLLPIYYSACISI
jgi:hypothetical protein